LAGRNTVTMFKIIKIIDRLFSKHMKREESYIFSAMSIASKLQQYCWK